MEIRYIILSIVILKVAIAGVCDKNAQLIVYSCDKNKKLKDDKCFTEEEGETDKATIHHVRDICGKDERCFDKFPFCFKKEMKRLEGESCALNAECSTRTCTNGKCVGVAENGKCVHSSDCKANLYCHLKMGDDRICEKLLDTNEDCSLDSDCKFDHMCALVDGNISKCLKMFSLDNNVVTDNPFVCKSGLLYSENDIGFKLLSSKYDPDAPNEGPWVCADSSLKGDGKCTTEEDCSYEVVSSTSSTVIGDSSQTYFCQCDGKGEQGYCLLGSKSDQVTKYLELYASETKDIKVDEDFDTAYLRNKAWGIPKLFQAMKDIENHQKIQNIDKCAIRYLTGANMMTISGLLVLISMALY